jgi:diguanylate cyclase (GGDEF)-like protein
VVRESGTGAVRLLGLGDPKGVNDTLGHLAGDKLLGAILARLEHVTRASDSLCRFGGEEFIYLSEDLTAPGRLKAWPGVSSTRWSNRFRSSGEQRHRHQNRDRGLG